MWVHYGAYMINCIPLGSLTFFTPTIVTGLGYDSIKAQLMTVPAWVVGYFFSLFLACQQIDTTLEVARYSIISPGRYWLGHCWLATRRRVYEALRHALPVCLRCLPKLRPAQCLCGL